MPAAIRVPELFRALAVATAALVVTLPAAGRDAAAPDAESASVTAAVDPAALVEQLGDVSFRVRQRAARQLEALGLGAKQALLAGLRHPDAEVRHRCQQVLVVVLELDFQQRLDAFVRDTEGTSDHGLAGWDRFGELVGITPLTRELFVEMQRAEPGLMESTLAGAQAAAEALEGRCREINEVNFTHPLGRVKQPDQVPLGTAAAALFVAGDPNVAVSDQVYNYVSSLTYQQPFALEITGGQKADALKRLLGTWIVRTAGSNNAFQSLMLAMTHGLKEGLVPAETLVRGGGQPQLVLYALLVIGRFGDRQHVPLVEPLLDNAAECQTAQVNGEDFKTQLRDVALAVLVHLTGQELKDYGLDRVQTHPQFLFNPATIGFTDKDDRDAPIRRYRQWAKEQAEAAEG